MLLIILHNKSLKKLLQWHLVSCDISIFLSYMCVCVCVCIYIYIYIYAYVYIFEFAMSSHMLST